MLQFNNPITESFGGGGFRLNLERTRNGYPTDPLPPALNLFTEPLVQGDCFKSAVLMEGNLIIREINEVVVDEEDKKTNQDFPHLSHDLSLSRG